MNLHSTGVLMGTIPFTIAANINNWSMPFFNVPMTVIGTAAFGSLISFAWGDPVPPGNKKKLYSTALASTFMAVVVVAVIPYMLGWTWITPKMEAPFAGLLAASMRFMIDPAINLIPDILRKFFGLGVQPKARGGLGGRHSRFNKENDDDTVE